MMADEKTCPRCAETVKSAALVCRFCGHEFGTPSNDVAAGPSTASNHELQSSADSPTSQIQPAQRGNVLGKAAGIGCLGILPLGFVSALVSGGSSGSNNVATSNVAIDPALTNTAESSTNLATPAQPTTTETPAAPASAWSYNTEHDDVRGGTRFFATVESENQADFDFPYSGGSTLTMTVRKHPQYGQDVYFVISKGQFVCGVEDCKGTINYGDGPRSITLSEPDDNSSDTLFASNGPSVIANLKKAKRVIVELPFYQEGNRQFTFDTHGLVWPPK